MARTSGNPWGNRQYVSQVEPPYGGMPFGGGTIREYGCGACCTANVLLHMGIRVPFACVVSHYAAAGQPVRLFGQTLGIMPWTIRDFFARGLRAYGIEASAELLWGRRGYERLLRDCRYVIAAVKWKGEGGHYIAVMKGAGGGICVADPGCRRESMLMGFKDIGGYLERSGGGFVIGAVGIDAAGGGARYG
jgi:hypothetical protein